MKKVFVGLTLCVLILTILFSSCHFETVAEYESRLTGEETGIGYESQTEAAEQTGEGSSGTKTTGTTEPERETAAAQAAVGSGEQTTAPRGETAPAGQTTTQQPAETRATQPTVPSSISVTVCVTCKNAVNNSALQDGISLPADGILLADKQLTVNTGTTAYALTKEACNRAGLELVSQGTSYIQRIGPLGEKECGAQSGWIYRVNGRMVMTSADRYQLQSGDRIEWVYVTKPSDM